MRNGHLLGSLLCVFVSTAAAQVPVAGPAQGAAPTVSPYVVRFDALEQKDADRLGAALLKIEGVAHVEADTARKLVQISAKAGKSGFTLLPEAQIRNAATRLGLKPSGFTEPDWAKTRVYVVEASGGG